MRRSALLMLTLALSGMIAAGAQANVHVRACSLRLDNAYPTAQGGEFRYEFSGTCTLHGANLQPIETFPAKVISRHVYSEKRSYERISGTPSGGRSFVVEAWNGCNVDPWRFPTPARCHYQGVRVIQDLQGAGINATTPGSKFLKSRGQGGDIEGWIRARLTASPLIQSPRPGRSYDPLEGLGLAVDIRHSSLGWWSVLGFPENAKSVSLTWEHWIPDASGKSGRWETRSVLDRIDPVWPSAAESPPQRNVSFQLLPEGRWRLTARHPVQRWQARSTEFWIGDKVDYTQRGAKLILPMHGSSNEKPAAEDHWYTVPFQASYAGASASASKGGGLGASSQPPPSRQHPGSTGSNPRTIEVEIQRHDEDRGWVAYGYHLTLDPNRSTSRDMMRGFFRARTRPSPGRRTAAPWSAWNNFSVGRTLVQTGRPKGAGPAIMGLRRPTKSRFKSGMRIPVFAPPKHVPAPTADRTAKAAKKGAAARPRTTRRAYPEPVLSPKTAPGAPPPGASDNMVSVPTPRPDLHRRRR